MPIRTQTVFSPACCDEWWIKYSCSQQHLQTLKSSLLLEVTAVLFFFKPRDHLQWWSDSDQFPVQSFQHPFFCENVTFRWVPASKLSVRCSASSCLSRWVCLFLLLVGFHSMFPKHYTDYFNHFDEPFLIWYCFLFKHLWKYRNSSVFIHLFNMMNSALWSASLRWF